MAITFRRLVKVGLFGLFIALVTGACGGGGEATPAPTAVGPTPTSAPGVVATPTPVIQAPTATPVTAEEPQYGGILITGSFSARVATGEWGPVRAGVVIPSALGAIRTTLLSQDAYDNYKIIGDLVDRWELAPDNSKLTLHVRPGVKWHDGAPFTADDVVSTLDYYMNPPAGHISTTGRLVLRPVIKEIVKINSETVELRLANVPASFMPRFAGGSFLAIPAHVDLDTASKTALGTGAFKLKSFERDISADYVRNPDYYLKDEQGRQLPYLDGVRWFQFNDQTLVLSALRTGRLRHTDNNTSSNIERNLDALRRDVPNMVFDQFIGGPFGLFLKNVAPLSDPKVREAINLFTDRKLYVDLGFVGLGYAWDVGIQAQGVGGQWGLPSEEIMSRPGYRYLDSSGKLVTDPDEARAKWNELKKDPADIARARQLLQEAGIKQGDFKAEIVSTAIGFTRTMPVMTAQFKELFGSTFPTRLLPTGDTSIADGRFTLYTSAFSGYNVDEPSISISGWLWGLSTSGPREQGVAEDDPQLVRIKDLFEQQEFTFDVQKRRELIQEMQRAMLAWTFKIPSNVSIGVATWWPEFRGYPELITAQRNDVVHRYDRVWIAQ